MDSSTRVVVNTGIQYVRTVVQVAIMLYTSRVVLDNLGVEDYGIYNLVGGVIAMLSFIQINLANTTIRYLSYHHGKNDMPMVIKIFNNSLCIQLFFGLVICVLLVCATDFVFANMLNISMERLSVAKVVYYLMIGSLFFNLVSTPYFASLISHENLVYSSMVQIVDSILKVPIVVSLIYVTFDKLIWYSCGSLFRILNDIANLCELVGADVNMVRKGIGSDSRIGSKFLYPGCGYGGSCFPKDVKALIKTAEKKGYQMQVLKAVVAVNESQKTILYNKLKKYYRDNLRGKTIALWGLAFKPETDDMREATALVTIKLLLEAGCIIKVFDPVAMNECKRRIGDAITYANDMYDAVLDADALLVLTEWKQFRLPSWGVIVKSMKNCVVVDGRNIYDSDELEQLGIQYYCIGK